MKAVRKVSQLRFWLLFSVLLLSLWTQALILYRIRNIDQPKEVHFMIPQTSSHALEIGQ